MALFVNTNVPSLNAQRNLVGTNRDLNQALERLSSGLRINRAGDDAAGLAISESLRTQIRGLNQAIRNANDGLSLVATAEGALGEVVNNIQRIRELAIQAANGTNSDSNRAAIQNEIDQLVEEIDRIGNTTQFNNRNLLDGTFVDVVFHVGANKDQTIAFSIDDTRASKLGAIAEDIGAAIATAATAATDLDDLIINGVQIATPVAGSDTVSTTQNEASAIALAAAINAVSAQSGVQAEINATVHTGGAAITAGTLDSTNSLTINGVQINGAVLAGDLDNSLREAINAVTNVTGVTASLSGSDLVLEAADGRNIEVVTAGTGGTISGLTAGVYKGSVTLVSGNTITVAGADVTNAGFVLGSTLVDPNTAINSVNVLTVEAAENTIRASDFALEQLIGTRAELGAITNRLEATISNLQTTSENLSASESRIRDADFAAETAALVRAQILQQAGISVLAQANLVPQAALSLLQG
jgi:flagellin